jgi:Cu2+-exporting ATPase
MTSIVLGYTGYPILRGAYVSLRAGRPNMDLLVALAAGTAYVYSTATLLLGGTEVYFDITTVVVIVVTLGGYYETRLKSRAAGQLTELTESRVAAARRRTGAGEETVSVDEVRAGDELVVGAGDRIPVDGTVIEGAAAVDESLVTGESAPVRRERGDEVIGGGLVTEGGIVVAADEGATSTLDRLMAHLWRVRSSRSGVQRLADRLAAVFVPVVVVLALGAFVIHLALGATPTAAFLTGLTVLVVSCPCALGLATPLAVAAGVREALDSGVVITDGDVFERATEADVVAFDKTGTLTTGEMTLHDAVGEEAAIARAAAVETFADHPMGRAVAEAVDVPDLPVDDFERHPGRGVSGVVNEVRVTVGRADLFEGYEIPNTYRERYDRAVDAGHVAAYVGWDGAVRGVLVAGDRPRSEWERVVSAVAADVARVVVLTGDGDAAAARFRDHPDVDEVFAGVPPEAKAEVVERLREGGTTVMVGDGSNDAPALAAADLGISLESGTRLAADAADDVVTTDDLTTVPEVFRLTAATKRRIRENLGWAFLYNALAVPAAALGVLNPLVAAVAMAASSLLVVGNSTRGLGDDAHTGEADDGSHTVDPSPASPVASTE